MPTNGSPKPAPVIKPMNYKAVEYLGWFMSDAQNVSNWSSQLFSSNVDLQSQRVQELKAAAENSLNEVENDVTKLRAYLSEYQPPQDKSNPT